MSGWPSGCTGCRRASRSSSPGPRLYEQFGQGFARVRDFRRQFLQTLAHVKTAYPSARISSDEQGLTLEHSPPPVAPRYTSFGSGPKPSHGKLVCAPRRDGCHGFPCRRHGRDAADSGTNLLNLRSSDAVSSSRPAVATRRFSGVRRATVSWSRLPGSPAFGKTRRITRAIHGKLVAPCRVIRLWKSRCAPRFIHGKLVAASTVSWSRGAPEFRGSGHGKLVAQTYSKYPIVTYL